MIQVQQAKEIVQLNEKSQMFELKPRNCNIGDIMCVRIIGTKHADIRTEFTNERCLTLNIDEASKDASAVNLRMCRSFVFYTSEREEISKDIFRPRTHVNRNLLVVRTWDNINSKPKKINSAEWMK